MLHALVHPLISHTGNNHCGSSTVPQRRLGLILPAPLKAVVSAFLKLLPKGLHCYTADIWASVLPRVRFSFPFPCSVSYLWEKYGLGDPAPSPLKSAEVTLNLLYNCLILGSKALELTSDQEASEAGLM